MAALEQLPFDNVYAGLGPEYGTPTAPTPLPSPRLVAFNPDAAALIDLEARDADRALLRDVLAGHARLPGSAPFAMVYAGHQFGTYVPRLGDGRALLLGQVRNARKERWDLHLKGAGPTPYSRGGDGRAVLRSTLREYLACEAMFHLGIPTTRALAIVASDLPVYREEVETAASLLRLSRGHLRFGTFEYFAHTGRHDELRALVDHALEHLLPEAEGPDRPVALLRAVVERTAKLIAAWQAVGFTHGVLNTDNMSILGETIDYGPYGFVDAFEPSYVPNHSDERGRYALDQQPSIGLWNLARFAEALLPLGLGEDAALGALEAYEPLLRAEYRRRMFAKLGLRGDGDQAWALVQELLVLMARHRADFTRLFRALGQLRPDDPGSWAAARDEVVDRDAFDAWARGYAARLVAEGSADDERRRRMDAVNPRFILRNYLAEVAIRRATDDGDFAELHRLHAVLRAPFDEQPEHAAYAEAPPAWGRHLALSCSS